MESAPEVFARVWATAKSQIFPAALEQQFFTEARFQELMSRARSAKNLPEFADAMNSFFKTLGVSHTVFLTKSDELYYLTKSLNEDHDPQLFHAGMQVERCDSSYYVKAVLDGYPAQLAGLRRGDKILEADGAPFHPIHSFASGKASRLLVKSADADIRVDVIPVFETLHASFSKAIGHSARIIKVGGKSVGYVRLWVGIRQKALAEFRRAIQEKLSGVDALVVDLRDGYGGAGHEHLDLFFENRDSFVGMELIDRDGQRSVAEVERVEPHWYFKGPMVALINQGTRSGKELMAYQLNRSRRATLVGTQSAGFVVFGRLNFTDSASEDVLMVSHLGLRLDGVNLEGVGMQPEVVVEYPTNVSLARDPQLDAALAYLA